MRNFLPFTFMPPPLDSVPFALHTVLFAHPKFVYLLLILLESEPGLLLAQLLEHALLEGCVQGLAGGPRPPRAGTEPQSCETVERPLHRLGVDQVRFAVHVGAIDNPRVVLLCHFTFLLQPQLGHAALALLLVRLLLPRDLRARHLRRQRPLLLRLLSKLIKFILLLSRHLPLLGLPGYRVLPVGLLGRPFLRRLGLLPVPRGRPVRVIRRGLCGRAR